MKNIVLRVSGCNFREQPHSLSIETIHGEKK